MNGHRKHCRSQLVVQLGGVRAFAKRPRASWRLSGRFLHESVRDEKCCRKGTRMKRIQKIDLLSPSTPCLLPPLRLRKESFATRRTEDTGTVRRQIRG